MREVILTIAEHPLASGVFGLFIIILAGLVQETVNYAIYCIANTIAGNRIRQQGDQKDNRTETREAKANA